MTLIEKFCTLYSSLNDVNPDELGSIYAQDVDFIDPIAHHHGLDAVKHYFAQLLDNTKTCAFDIKTITPSAPGEDIHYTITWVMTLVLKGKTDPIVLDGITILKVSNEKIHYHRDYYDLGEMVYQHIPILGWVIGKIKSRLQS